LALEQIKVTRCFMNEVSVIIVGQANQNLWSLKPETRLSRLSARVGAGQVKSIAELGAEEPALLLQANAVIEERLVRALLSQPGKILTAPSYQNAETIALAARVNGRSEAEAAAAAMTEVLPKSPPRGLCYGTAESIAGAYDPILRKQAVPFAAQLGDTPKNELEKLTFGASYKGATDFVTKYVWPTPARFVTKWCAAAGFTPNQVTTLSLILMFLALAGFWQGQWLWAIPAAWAMTFLDTVDGKLARVTMTSSKWGEVYDHGIDLIHPPFWWWAWYVGAYSAAEARGQEFLTSYDLALSVISVGYVIQRIYEGAFLWIFKIEGHIWRPFDFWFRTITARRNPNLFILMISALVGSPDLGIIAVAIWVLASLGVHFIRISHAGVLKLKGRPVTSFLKGG
jgi:phosphatidylglycerophosphate synthase